MLDTADRKLLAILQENARTGIETLAFETGLSTATVQRRLKALRDSGVIERDVSIVDPAKAGLAMTFIVMVELERERLDEIDAFVRRVRADPHVQQCYYITGDADFCMICTAANMEGFEALTNRLFFDDSNVRRFRTSVVMGRKKTGLSLPLDVDGQ
jgi:Lrp/AsnC family leucine-responsive transcriptional regulator